jgi:beta-galactosidase
MKRNNTHSAKDRNQIRWNNIEWEPGYIEAVARTAGKVVARHRIETTGKAKGLVARGDNASWKADGMDLQHVRLTAVDSKGRRCLSYDDELAFTVSGDASIVAVTNGDIATDEIATQQHVRLWQGQAMVILRSGRQPSKVTLTTKPQTFKDIITKLETK